jgi:hypothetical protein
MSQRPCFFCGAFAPDFAPGRFAVSSSTNPAGVFSSFGIPGFPSMRPAVLDVAGEGLIGLLCDM